jgi:uncharacterized protein YjbI with pentapeptide repeats
MSNKVLKAVIIVSTILMGAGVCPGQAQEPATSTSLRALGRLTPAEQYVLGRVAAGTVADLKEKFGENEAARTLRGRFVEALLTEAIPGFKVPHSGIYLVNAVVAGPLGLEFAVVDPAVFLVGCRFKDLVNCAGSLFKKNLVVKQVMFDQTANFYRLHVGVDAFFGGTVFQGPVDFGGANIEGQFTLTGARFSAQPQETNFNGLMVGQSLSLKKAVFAGGADFTRARIGGEFNAGGARFEGSKRALFNGLKVGQHASLLQAVFQGPVDLGGAEIGGEFFADQAHFETKEHKVSFNGFKVGPRATFDGTVFQGPVDFSMATVAGIFILNQVRFDNPEQKPNFFGLKVGQHAFISDTTFRAGVSLVGTQFKNLMLNGSSETALSYKEVNLDGAQVDYSLIIGDLAVANLQAARLQVKGPAILKNLKISQKVDLRDSSLYSLKLIDVTWPAEEDQIWLEGLTYQALSAGEGPRDWEKLLAWVRDSRFDTRNYSQLEAYFRHGGYQDRADEVYIQGKRREVMDQWWRPDHLATLIFWDGLAGYGKKPSRAFWLSLIIVLVGTMFFDHRNFDPNFVGGWIWMLDGNVWRTAVVRFLLSLDEFLPGVDLGLAQLWQMSKISYPTLLYYHFQKISGWILVPIGLAAVFSQFR